MIHPEDSREENYEHLGRQINSLLGDMSVRKKLLRVIYIFGTLNLVIWLCCLLFPSDVRQAFERVHELNQKFSTIVLAVPFAIGMLITYGIFRLRFPDIEDVDLDSEVFGSYSYQRSSQKRWLVWLFSTVGGILNLFLLFVAVIAITG